MRWEKSSTQQYAGDLNLWVNDMQLFAWVREIGGKYHCLGREFNGITDVDFPTLDEAQAYLLTIARLEGHQ